MIKRYIFKKSFEEIFTPQRIQFEASKLKTQIDINNFFDFAPHQSFLLPKDNNQFRQISIPDTKTKIIQRILTDELSSHLKFSDRNYAYQKNKSPLKAINRVKHIIKDFDFVIKADIEKFFDNINHDYLLKKLNKIIKDKKIIYLITLFLKNGSLFKNQWIDKFEGIYQGDVLSPLLSNIYLHNFDISLEKREIEFVRYADDIILFAKSYKEAQSILHFIKQRLKFEDLKLNEDKVYITHKSKTFEYLGIRFDVKEQIYSIDNDRLMQKISKISKETKSLNLEDAINKLNEHIQGFHNYYLKIINNQTQFELLQKREDEIIISKIIQAKQTKEITNKKEFLKHLQILKTYIPIQNYAYKILNKAYQELKLQTPIKSAQKDIENKKRDYLKNQLKSTELIITKTGTYLYFSQGKIKIRIKNEQTKQVPFNKLKRIIITNKQTSLSTYLIYQCSKHKIDIDFIDNLTPYALLTYNKTISKELHLKQLKIATSNIALNYAKAIHTAKAKNQKNLLKYFNYRRKNEQISQYIQKISKLIAKINRAKDTKTLMAIEGQISSLYWSGFKIIIEVDDFVRTHQNSTDPINQALNYGYAIIYNRVQSALIKEGLNIYYSFLHTTNYTKPTLVYDFIEPFRQPIVDREIISIITKGQKLKIGEKNLLTQQSKKLVIQNIQERLNSLTKTKYGKTTYLNTIYFEANSLKHAIEMQKEKHKFFVAKY